MIDLGTVKSKMTNNIKLICKHCTKSFEGTNKKFCSQGCRDSYIGILEKRMEEAVVNDATHTRQLSGY
ncbi:hypothetical protein [Nitrosopumilus sp. S6]